jgi:hypothetical protein
MSEAFGFTEFLPGEREKYPPSQQRLVRRHPGSKRKTLYLAAHASHVVGWPVPEGRILLYDLNLHATRPEFVYSHKWRVGDLVIWDNRCTMHRGRPHDDREAEGETSRSLSSRGESLRCCGVLPVRMIQRRPSLPRDRARARVLMKSFAGSLRSSPDRRSSAAQGKRANRRGV